MGVIRIINRFCIEMRAVDYPRNIKALLASCPSVGCLMDLCDENYRFLAKLAPGLKFLEGRLLSSMRNGMDLYLEVLEQTPYTTLIRLTYYFPDQEGRYSDPDAVLRVYHDSRQVEVLDLRQQALPLKQGKEPPTLEQKWKANLFLSKWLAYCTRQGHRFTLDFDDTDAPCPMSAAAC